MITNPGYANTFLAVLGELAAAASGPDVLMALAGAVAALYAAAWHRRTRTTYRPYSDWDA